MLSAGQVGAQFANASMQWGFDGRTKTGTTGSLNKTATNKSNTKVSLQRQLAYFGCEVCWRGFTKTT